MSTNIEEKYLLKIVDEYKDCEISVMLASGENKRPMRNDYDIIDPLEFFMEYSDALDMLEGKLWTPDLWFWLKVLNVDW